MRAIPTGYRGTMFRSRLEAQWAEFFDDLSIGWDYEPEGYSNGKINYLPDFWLPDVCSRGKRGGVFFEVKPSSPLSGEVDKAVMLAAGSKRPVIIVSSRPNMPALECLSEFVRNDSQDWDDHGLVFAQCPACGQCDIGFYTYRDGPLCSCGTANFTRNTDTLDAARESFPMFARWKPAA